MHWHHLKPRHVGGTDHPSNLLRVTIEEHALIHEARWYAYHHWQDWIAWKALEGQIDKEEIQWLKNSLGHKGKKCPDQAQRMSGNDYGKHKKGWCWYTNGYEDTISDKCPVGFYKGRSKIKGHSSWNRGLTINDPRVARNIKKDPKTGRFVKQYEKLKKKFEKK